MTLQLHDDLRVGAATHTGRVRSTNEDDYLLLVPDQPEKLETLGRLFVIADGMGGAVGGAEASRAAIRALAASLLDSAAEADERMRDGFARACRDVFEMSRESPVLRDMGTTLTALNLLDGHFVLGHIGDTRCLRVRGGELEQLTEDHAVRETAQHLTRCVGAGRPEEEADVIAGELAAGDVFILVSDGVWSVVSPETIVAVARGGEPQAIATELVRLANEAGGRDNGTALVIEVARLGEPGPLREVELPAEEEVQDSALPAPGGDLRSVRWPWIVVLLVSAVLGTLAVLRGAFDIDVVGAVASWIRDLTAT